MVEAEFDNIMQQLRHEATHEDDPQAALAEIVPGWTMAPVAASIPSRPASAIAGSSLERSKR